MVMELLVEIYRNAARTRIRGIHAPFRSILAVWCLMAVTIAACTTASDAPPAGTVVADLKYPAVGSRWMARRTDTINGSSIESEFRLVQTTYNGAAAFAFETAGTSTIVNPTNFNVMMRTSGNQVSTSKPDSGSFSWPLWVGKSWSPSFEHENKNPNAYFRDVSPLYSVKAYEDVTVPAGTFKAFRISVSPGWNFQNDGVSWYAPEVGLVVKSVFHEHSFRGNGTTTTELLTRPQ